MTMKTTAWVLPLAFSMLSLTACSAATSASDGNTAAKHSHAHSHHGHAHVKSSDHAPTHYQKPGAAVQFSHNFSGSATDSSLENITLNFRDNYPTGRLVVDILDTDGVSIVTNGRQQTFQMNGTEHAVDLQVSAPKGLYTLNFQVTAYPGDGQVLTRSFAIDYNVGTKSEVAAMIDARKAENAQKVTEPGLIVMEAEETIITGDQK